MHGRVDLAVEQRPLDLAREHAAAVADLVEAAGAVAVAGRGDGNDLGAVQRIYHQLSLCDRERASPRAQPDHSGAAGRAASPKSSVTASA